MELRVQIPTALRDLVSGEHVIIVNVAEPATVAGALDALAIRCPALERRIRDELGCIRTHVNVFVGADNVKDCGGLSAGIAAGTALSIIPAISGG